MTLVLRYKYKVSQKDEKLDLAKMKLSKLLIAKLRVNYLNWLRFSDKFNAQIAKSALPAVSKFCYLKELVIPKVKVWIHSLPFNSE